MTTASLQVQLRAIWLNMRAGDGKPPIWRVPCTRKQVSAIQMAMKEIDRTDRLAILSYFLGFNIQTTKDMTKWEASVLIDAIKFDPEIIEYARQACIQTGAIQETQPAN